MGDWENSRKICSMLCVMLVGILVRVLPRLSLPRRMDQIASDTYFHLIMGRRIRELGLKETIRRFPSYPLAFHFLLSFMRPTIAMKWERWNGAFFDSVHVIVFAFVFSKVAPAAIPPEVIWFWAPLLLVLSPAWLYVGIGPRAYNGTERVMGELLITCIFVSLTLYSVHGNFLWMAAAVVLGGVVLLTSKFSAQVLLFFSIIWATWTDSVVILFLPLYAFVVANILSRGGYQEILFHQIKHLIWYTGAVKKREVSLGDRNSWSIIANVYKRDGLLKTLAQLFVGSHLNTFTGAFFQHQFFILGLVSCFFLGFPNLPSWLWIWMSCGIVCWVITSCRAFVFIGEAERYLLSLALPEYIFVGYCIHNAPYYWRYIALGLSLLSWIALASALRFSHKILFKNPAKVAQRQQLVDLLKTLPPQRLINFDFSIGYDLAYLTPHAHFWVSDKVSDAFHQGIFLIYPFIRWKAVEFFDSELLVVSKEAVTKAKSLKLEFDLPLESLQNIFENETYVLYQTKSVRGSS